MTSPAAARGGLRIDLLGPLVVRSSQEEVLPVAGARPRAVLAFLALAGGRPVPANRIVEVVLGGRGGPRAAATLRTYLSKLRTDLGRDGDTLRRVSGGYLLDVELDDVDGHRFRHLVAAAHHGRPAERLDVATKALALWRGAPLVELAGTPWGRAEANALENLRLEALQLRAGARLDLGDPSAALPELEAAVREHPHREDLVGLLMIALYSAGRQAEALRLYPQTRERLAAELGVEPTPALREIHRAVLGQEADLRRLRPDRPPALPAAGLATARHAEPAQPAPALAHRLLRDAESSPGPRLLLVTGNPGVGKTYLLDGIAGEARQGGAQVVSARAVEGSASLALLRSLLDDDGDTVPVKLLRRRIGPLADPGVLATAVAEWLRTASRSRPLVLVVDDLEHLDLATARVLAEALTLAEGGRCSVVGAARYADLPGDHPVRRLTSALRRRDRLDLVPLDGLDRAGVGRLVAEAGGSTADVDRLMTKSGGNAFLVTHLLRASHAEACDLPGLQAVVADFVRDLLAPLPQDALDVLAAAAALGHQFRLDAVAAAVQSSEEDVARRLTAAVHRHLVVDAGAGRYRFVHGAVRDGLVERLGRTRSGLVRRRASVGPRHLRSVSNGPASPPQAQTSRSQVEAGP